MRLYEVSSLTKDQFKPQHRENPKAVGKDFGQEDQEEIGSGMFAEVFSTPQEPGTVRKISTEPTNKLDNDAYFQYVNMIAKNDRMTGNLYFPRVFNIQVRSFDRKGVKDEKLGVEYVYAVDLERLLPFSSLSSKEAHMLGDKMFYDFGKKFRPNRVVSGGTSRLDYRDVLSSRIEDTFMGKGPYLDSDPTATIIKDKHYKQAVMLIKAMIEKSDGMHQDIHDENIMVRRGPGGPHIVITDPVMGR